MAQQSVQPSLLSEDSITHQERLSLAKSFVSRVKANLSRADSYLLSSLSADQKNILPEGEIVLLQPVLHPNFRLDGVILGRVHNKKILLSLRDFSDLLQIPINIDLDNKVVQGWYIRENKPFNMDLNQNTVHTDVGDFNIPEDIIIEDGDVFVPSSDLGQWMNFEFDPVISTQELRITSSELLPIQERHNRRKNRIKNRKMPKPSLPLISDAYDSISAPVIDVSTRSTYKRNSSSGAGVDAHNVSINTSGDLARGTLTTQSQLNDRDNLRSVRVNYRQESVDGDLLGALKARKFEIGDVTTANVPLGGTISQELGVRVTNTDSLRTFSTPTTGISGTAISGWDVELYRDDQFVAFQEVGDDGFYQFANIDLFQSNNNFRLVFYGPQGEVREEDVYVPVDQNLLSRGKGIYDVSVSLDGKSTYNKLANRIKDDDSGSLNVAAIYERPIADGATALVGLRSNQVNGDRNIVANVGVSAVAAQVLFNAGVAVDDEGELSSELALRRDFGEHKFSDNLNWLGANFDSQSGSSSDKGFLKNRFSVNGPLPFMFVKKPRYNFTTNYTLDTDGEYSITSAAGVNGALKNVSFNESITYSTGSNVSEDNVSLLTNLTGSYGRNRLRFTADYDVKPDSELKSILARYSRDITKKLDFEIGVSQRPQASFTEYSAKLDWQAGFMRISPSVKYDSEHDFFAGLNTRFGILKDPSTGRVKMYDRNVTNSGMVSTFVYLDKDGDGEFNGKDEPLENIVVKALQNGGRERTDQNGIALFTSMGKLRLTDVFVDPESLQDPTWVTGFDGVSILPRAGYVAQINFPVHISGELDGSVYARAVPLPLAFGKSDITSKPVPLRNVRIHLYNDKGELAKNIVTDAGGFYYVPAIAPGRYLLVIDEKSAKHGNFIRPEPQQIEIAYDGTIIYGNNIYVDTGSSDIPSEFLSDLDDYKSRHPHIDFSNDNNDIVLNLGEFNSRLLMSVVWYKIRSRYSAILHDAKLFVPPAKSYASAKTGKHELRVGLVSSDLSEAYERCRAFMARQQYCKVEIYPSYMKHASASD